MWLHALNQFGTPIFSWSGTPIKQELISYVDLSRGTFKAQTVAFVARPFDYTTILSLNFELWSATCSTSTKTWKRHTLGNRNEAIDFEILLASWALIYFWTLYELIYVTCLRFCGRLRWSVGCERALCLLQNVCTAYHLRSAILPKSNCDSHLSAESCSRTDSTGITFSRERKLSGQRAVLLAGDSFMQVYSDYH